METLRGVIHGRVIELEREPGLPDGQSVAVLVQPVADEALRPGDGLAGDGLRRAFGGWAEDAEQLDAYLRWSRQQRKRGRPGIEP